MGFVSSRFAHQETENVAQSCLPNISSLVRLDGEHLWTAIFKSYQKFAVRVTFGFWLEISNLWLCIDLNHSIATLVVCFSVIVCFCAGKPAQNPPLFFFFCSILISINSCLYICTCWRKVSPQHDVTTTMFPGRSCGQQCFHHIQHFTCRPESDILISSDQICSVLFQASNKLQMASTCGFLSTIAFIFWGLQSFLRLQNWQCCKYKQR